METMTFQVLAELPDPGGYVSIFRVVFILVWFFLFCAFAQWVNADTRFVRAMSRNMWNPIILATGVFATAIWLLGPWSSTALFFAGWGLWLLLIIGAGSVYVVLRNRYVDAGSRVFTPQHISDYLSTFGKGDKKKKALAVEQVSITKADGKKLAIPQNPEEVPAYETLQTMLFDALWRRATDVIFAMDGQNVRLIYKIDGVNTERRDLLTREQADGVLHLFKWIAGLKVDEHRKPQTGHVKALHPTADRTRVDVEVTTSGTRTGERLDLRLTTQESRLRLPDIGLTEKQFELFQELINLPTGLVLVSGPKTSGVTTTLYAALREHDAFLQNLHSLERERLMDLDNITQNAFDASRTEVSYARQLQTILRREPDVVMVSDCEDRETAHIAAQAAINGKKMYMGIQAKDSIDALKKFVSLCADSDTASAALTGVTSQRLVRKLCPACREAYKPDRALLRKANIPADKVDVFYRARTEPLLDKRGRPVLCPNCQGSGYYGRTGVLEILVVDEAIRKLIRDGQPAKVILQQCRKSGMRFMQEVGVEMVIKGITSMNEIIRGLRDEEPQTAVAADVRKAEK